MLPRWLALYTCTTNPGSFEQLQKQLVHKPNSLLQYLAATRGVEALNHS
jgi:hypothetical protein